MTSINDPCFDKDHEEGSHEKAFECCAREDADPE